MGLNVSVRAMHERIGSYTDYDMWRTDILDAAQTQFNPPEFDMIMDHSDCDGEYTVDVLPILLEELEEVQELGVDTNGITTKMLRLCKYGIETKENMYFY